MKDLHEDDIIGSVRERMGRYEEAPSEAVWERIAAQRGTKDRAWPLWVEMISLVGMGVVVFSLMNVKVTDGEVKEEANRIAGVVNKESEQARVISMETKMPDQISLDPVNIDSTETISLRCTTW